MQSVLSIEIISKICDDGPQARVDVPLRGWKAQGDGHRRARLMRGAGPRLWSGGVRSAHKVDDHDLRGRAKPNGELGKTYARGDVHQAFPCLGGMPGKPRGRSIGPLQHGFDHADLAAVRMSRQLQIKMALRCPAAGADDASAAPAASRKDGLLSARSRQRPHSPSGRARRDHLCRAG